MNHGSHVAMVYRRTEKTVRRLAQRHGAIIAAARASAAEGGMAAVQVAPVAARAGIAAGTVYRYFPSKTDLVAALVAAVSALAAAIATFASRAMAQRRLAWAVIGEPVDAQADAVRLVYRQALAAEFQTRIERAIRGGHLPAQDAHLSAAAAVGALLESLIGPLASASAEGELEPVEALMLYVLRGLGIPDARARGFVV